jgi:hypothetical protein
MILQFVAALGAVACPPAGIGAAAIGAVRIFYARAESRRQEEEVGGLKAELARKVDYGTAAAMAFGGM